MEKILTHKFTEAGLGDAPFTFVGVSENLFSNGDGTFKPGGCCDYCFTSIRYEFHIMSANGKKSKVGCDCIRKVHDHQLIEVSELAKKKLEKEKKQQAREAKRQKELNRQREENNGLTNYELSQKIYQEKLKQEEQLGLTKGLKFQAEIARLGDGKNGFRDSVANDIKRGRLPQGRGLNIVLDILSKQCGKSGSKAYFAEYERLENLFQ